MSAPCGKTPGTELFLYHTPKGNGNSLSSLLFRKADTDEAVKRGLAAACPLPYEATPYGTVSSARNTNARGPRKRVLFLGASSTAAKETICLSPPAFRFLFWTTAFAFRPLIFVKRALGNEHDMLKP